MKNSGINLRFSKDDIFWMKKALALARKASARNEVPVGALLVGAEGILSYGYNLRETLKTSIGHAEILAIHRASKKLDSWRLLNSTLYVTLEPCLMCAGAILQARIPRLVYGASDPKGGAVKSLFSVLTDSRLNHQVEIIDGVLSNQCGQILTDFFKKRRLNQKKLKIDL